MLKKTVFVDDLHYVLLRQIISSKNTGNLDQLMHKLNFFQGLETMTGTGIGFHQNLFPMLLTAYLWILRMQNAVVENAAAHKKPIPL